MSIGGEFLVFEGQRREVEIGTSSDNGIALGIVQFADTQSALQLTSGELQGLYTARDEIVGGFSTDSTSWPARWPSNSTRSIRKARAWSASSS